MSGDDKPWINVKVMTWAMDRAPIPVDTKIDKNGRKTVTVNRVAQLVLWALASRARDDYGRHCFPSVAWLAHRVNVWSEDEVRRALHRLVKDGIISPGDETYPPYRKLRANRRPKIYDCHTYLTRERCDPCPEQGSHDSDPGPEQGSPDPGLGQGSSEALTPVPNKPDPCPGPALTPVPDRAKEALKNNEEAPEPLTGPTPGMLTLPSDPIDDELRAAMAVEEKRRDEAIERGDDRPDSQIQHWYFRLAAARRADTDEERLDILQQWVDAGRDPS